MSDILLPTLQNHTHIWCDTETTGLGRYDVPVGLSYALEDGTRRYVRWAHRRGGNNIELPQVLEWWQREVIDRGLTVVFHNAVYDCRMMTNIGARMPVRIEDTCVIAALLNEYEKSYSLEELSRTYLGPQHVKDSKDLEDYCVQFLGGKVGKGNAGLYHLAPGDIVEPYAEQDAHLTRLLYKALRPRIDEEGLNKIFDTECGVTPVLVRMYQAGVRVSTQRASTLRDELLLMHDKAMNRLNELNGGKFNPRSSKQVDQLLAKFGIQLEKTAKGNPKADKEALKNIDHEVVALINDARRAAHYADTFIESYIFSNVTEHECIHPSFHQAKSAFGGTITGRFSSSGGLNAQNIPKRDSTWAPKIRGMFIPAYDEGQWLRLDFSQIEYRFFAHYAGGEVQRRYNEDPTVDYHQMVSELTGVPRDKAKGINFGFLYGMGERKLARGLGLDGHESREIFSQYHSAIPEVRLMAARASNKAISRGYVVTWGGRRCRFKRMDNGAYMDAHKALNKLLQGSAADLIKVAMIEVDKVINWEDEILHLTVHDELDMTVPPGEEGMESAKRIKQAMEGAGILRVPVIAEAELGDSWGNTPTPVE